MDRTRVSTGMLIKSPVHSGRLPRFGPFEPVVMMCMIHAIRPRLLLCTLLIIGLGPISAHAQDTSVDVDITLDPERATRWTVDENIFGKFFEPNGRDAYPGIYAQHLSNSSLEEWYHRGNEPWRGRTSILFRDTQEYSGLAYPWEPVGTASYAQVDRGAAHGNAFQQILVVGESRGGIKQRTALPHHRTLGYDLSFTARGEFVDSLEVSISAGDGDIVLGTQKVALDKEWRRDTLHFDLSAALGPCYEADGGVCSPSGIYTVQFEVQGTGAVGTVHLDRVMLMPDDAVQGIFNPTTIDWLQRFNVPSIRWGGNWMSAYEWEDGIGPIEDRPVKRNLAWGGLEHNYLGTAEFLEFCKVAGVEPLLNVAFNWDGNPPETTPDEAADWVEYVNGSVDTEMGALRAAHGYPEPWNVELWQVGNETYGGYQYGHTDEVDYATKMRSYSAKMHAVDSTITFIAAGVDPLYRDYGENGQRPTWNQTLIDIAGAFIDGIDIHRYVRGTVNNNRRNTIWTEPDYQQALVAFPTQYEDILEILRADAEVRGYQDMLIEVGEWNLQPAVSAGWRRANYPKMAHAAFVAGMYNAFIRQGDVVRWTYQRDNTLFYRPFPIDFRAINPGQYTLEFYAEPFLDRPTDWHHLPLEMDGPTFFMQSAGVRQQDTPDVPYVDGAAIVSNDQSTAYAFLVNRDLVNDRRVRVQLNPNWRVSGNVAVVRQEATDDPFTPQFDWGMEPPFLNSNTFTVTNENAVVNDGVVEMSMAPSSIVRMEFQLVDVTSSERPLGNKTWTLLEPYPNPAPAGRDINLEMQLARSGRVDVALYDVLGRRVSTLYTGHKPEGRHRVSIETEGLAAGSYFVRMRAGDVLRTKTIVVSP